MFLLLRYRQLVLLIRMLKCYLFKHKWEIIGWEFAGTRRAKPDGSTKIVKHSMRLEQCSRCFAESSIWNDELGQIIFEFKKKVWQERRRVIVEKHENKLREYCIEVKHISFENSLLTRSGFYIYDSELEIEQKRLDDHVKTVTPALVNGEYSIRYKLLDEKKETKKKEEELPEELRDVRISVGKT